MEEETRETPMVDRESVELAWRKEFDDLGEEGVRHEFFKSAYLSDQRKEGFAYRWLGEKRKVQERGNADRSIRAGLVVVSIVVILVGLAAAVLLIGGGEILDKTGSALRFSWKAIAGIFGASP